MPANVVYTSGDATRPDGTGPRIIVHVCNDVGGWGAGFVLALSRRWAAPEAEYRAWHAGRATNDFRLGAVRLVEVEPGLLVANLIGQHGTRATGGQPPIRYDAIRTGLAVVRERALALGASVHMPRIGAGLAGGRWEDIEPIIVDELASQGVSVTVYDLPPRSE